MGMVRLSRRDSFDHPHDLERRKIAKLVDGARTGHDLGHAQREVGRDGPWVARL